LADGVNTLVPESAVEPVTDVQAPNLDHVGPADIEAFAKTAVLRLNGGLGTSMGLDQAKSLLPVRQGMTFLDIIARQVLAARQRYGVRLPLVFLHSFATRDDCLAALAKYPDLPISGIGLDMVQSQEPKLLAADLSPVEWPANPKLEWCPPGHGDLYPTLLDSGMLDALIEAGFRYCNVSNCDNLGAAPSPALAGWFARSGAPFAAELTRRTAMDLKGGHIVRRKSNGRLMLRETAQISPQDMVHFTDATRHPFTSTNNLWFDLLALRQELVRRDGMLDLSLIRNVKTVDPSDKTSPKVIQIESAMGAAIEVFDAATVVAVPRHRFLPVKTTTELTLLVSDVYDWGDDFVPRPAVAKAPVLTLNPHYTLLANYTQRLPHPLGLRQASSLTVQGDWQFGADVTVVGDVTLGTEGGTVPAGATLGRPA
jgi:UTP--glucose-1-phosphate uridylyltransferase